jgi:HK97 gp10 family phage protein
MASDQLARLQRRLERIPIEVRKAVQPALDKSANELVGRMRHLAPVQEEDGGELRDSIHAEQGDHELARRVVAGGDTAPYALHVEYGTVHADASPYFWPSYRLLRKRITGRIKRAVSKAVRDYSG